MFPGKHSILMDWLFSLKSPNYLKFISSGMWLVSYSLPLVFVSFHICNWLLKNIWLAIFLCLDTFSFKSIRIVLKNFSNSSISYTNRKLFDFILILDEGRITLSSLEFMLLCDRSLLMYLNHILWKKNTGQFHRLLQDKNYDH